jgi:hypothetical protein
MTDTDKYAVIREYVACLSSSEATFHISKAKARNLLADLDAANTRADEAEAMCEWLASDNYIAACPPNAPLHKPLVWSADGMTVEDGGCGGDAERCVRCRLAAAREAVRDATR